MKLFLAKTFFKSGDVEYNYKKIIEVYDEAVAKNCGILVFTELALTGYISEYPSKEIIKKNDDFLEKITNYTKDKKTQIMLGCLQYSEAYKDEDGVNRPEKLFNSCVIIANGYIQANTSMTNISKNNIFNSHKFFDKEITLRELKYESDQYNILLSDDIMESKNILFIKERDSEFTFCFDTSIEPPIKQLKKIASWTRKGLIYMNAFSYNHGKKFNGEIIILNGVGEVLYQNLSIAEDIVAVSVGYVIGVCEIFIDTPKKKKSDNFANVIARNEPNKKIIYEVKRKQNFKFEKNVKVISFKDIEGVEYIDYKKYINLNVKLNDDIKKIIIDGIYKNCIYLKE
ncbi:MAG: hypothetical protein LBT02_03240 [Rickettsiales bacterium]|jgi:hypothetical protein|nr:hypothetical protein [Rickettsiales bacterium]